MTTQIKERKRERDKSKNNLAYIDASYILYVNFLRYCKILKFLNFKKFKI